MEVPTCLICPTCPYPSILSILSTISHRGAQYQLLATTSFTRTCCPFPPFRIEGEGAGQCGEKLGCGTGVSPVVARVSSDLGLHIVARASRPWPCVKWARSGLCQFGCSGFFFGLCHERGRVKSTQSSSLPISRTELAFIRYPPQKNLENLKYILISVSISTYANCRPIMTACLAPYFRAPAVVCK
jgi:hypothetical protein